MKTRRLLVSGAAILTAIVVLPPLILAWAYGEPEPCRALAVERARLAADKGAGPANVLEPWQRLATSQMSAGQCFGGMLDSWGERLSRHMTR